jgi:uncharacterized protein YggT (Ycf19 family)
VERLPAFVKILLPCLITGLLWLGISPLLAKVGFQLPAKSLTHTAQQAAVIGLGAIMVWKYLIAGLLLVHLVTSYVYLGNAPFWTFTSVTARNLLHPLRWLPLRFGRIDLSPLLGAALVLALGEIADHWLPVLYRRLPL